MFAKGARHAVVIAGALGGLYFVAVLVTGEPGALAEKIQTDLNSSLARIVSITWTVGIIGIFALERLLPARPTEQGITPPVAMDAFYTFLLFPVSAALMVFALGPLNTLLDNNFSWLVIDSTRDWPLAVQVALGVLISDFASWLNHVLKHKVPFLWRFHIIHHSQTRLNMFTPDRVHPFEKFFDGLFNVLPFFILFPSFTDASGSLFIYILFFAWYTKLQHSNIRLNMGPLRYILVTPQSHRVHHSTEPQHFNSNYGNIFCWDRLVGFQSDDDFSYPTTGINDKQFPQPKKWSINDIGSSIVGQMLYPFDRDAVRKASEGSPHDAAAAAPLTT